MSDVYKIVKEIRAEDVYSPRELSLDSLKKNFKYLDREYEWAGEFRPPQKREVFRNDAGRPMAAPGTWPEDLPRLIFRPVKKYRFVLESPVPRFPKIGEWYCSEGKVWQASMDFQIHEFLIFTREEVTE